MNKTNINSTHNLANIIGRAIGFSIVSQKSKLKEQKSKTKKQKTNRILDWSQKFRAQNEWKPL